MFAKQYGASFFNNEASTNEKRVFTQLKGARDWPEQRQTLCSFFFRNS